MFRVQLRIMDNETISPQLFVDVTRRQFALIRDLLIMTQALNSLLVEMGLISASELAAAVVRASEDDRFQKMQEALDEDFGKESIEELLQNFDGPIQ
jgi:hypothetical protein